MRYDYEQVKHDPAQLLAYLENVSTFGFAFLKNLPLKDGHLTQVVDLGPHTDNPYRHPCPTLQLLHCLESESKGGKSILVDGLKVAYKLKEKNPEAFRMLTRYPVTFRFCDKNADLLAHSPIIIEDQNKKISRIVFNHRSMQPWQHPFEVMEEFLDAYQLFARMLDDPAHQIRFDLKPGDLLMMDNERTLHGREPFRLMSKRHLQGCYADKDSLLSKIRILKHATV